VQKVWEYLTKVLPVVRQLQTLSKPSSVLEAVRAEKVTTSIVGNWIERGLTEYVQAGKSTDGEGWKAKDSAIYLPLPLILAAQPLINTVLRQRTHSLMSSSLSRDHVYEDLQAQGNITMYTPIWQSPSRVVSDIDTTTWSKFIQTDIHETANDLINALLSKTEAAGTPEKVAENDHLMKCTMRVIVTARQSLSPNYQRCSAIR
ncbi:importin-alpha export receptor, partial [Paramarasmius palmivorus]